MKVKTAVISIVVSAALVGGAGYGAYYAMQGSKSPVEVVPVANVNTGYWGGSESFFGTVTSQIAQTVQLNDEYTIDEVFVAEGDEVKEGDPLFSYDMTLQELEYEMEELSLQTQELTMTKLEKDLETLKNTRATASLEGLSLTMTASAQEDILIDEDGGGSGAPAGGTGGDGSGAPADGTGGDGNGAPADGTGGDGSGAPVDGTGGDGSGAPADGTGGDGSGAPADGTGGDGSGALADGTGGDGNGAPAGNSGSSGLTVEDVEEISSSADGTEEEVALVNSVVSYERIVMAIDVLFRTYGEDLRADEVGDAIGEAVAYYRRHLADEKVTEAQNADGSVSEVREFVLKDKVRSVLSEEDIEKLQTYTEKLDAYQTRHVEMLIQETAQLADVDTAAFLENMTKIQEYYDLLATKQQQAVENANVWEELKQKAENLPAQEESSSEEAQTEETGTDETDTEDTGAGETATEGAGETELEISEELENAVYGAEGDADVNNTGDANTTPPEPDEPESETEIDLAAYITTFTGMAGELLADDAAAAYAALGKDYAAELENAVFFYQQWLGELPEEILNAAFAQTTMEQYVVREKVQQYLNDSGQAYMIEQLGDFYHQICIKYVRALFDKLDASALVRADLEKASEMYNLLGENWVLELEAQWQQEQMENSGQSGTGSETDTEVESEGDGSQSIGTAASIGDLLTVYNVYLLLQEYQAMDPNETEENRMAALQKIQEAYLSLTEEQKLLAAQNTELVNTLKQYGMWEDPTLPEETEDFGDFDDFGDFGDFGDDMGYTASELKEMIEEKEQEIATCALDIREIELNLKAKKRILDGKIVKSTLDGTVVSIGTADGESEDDYFVKVTNQTGLYAQGSMNELALEQIKVGDTISGMMTSTGVSFTAVIKEISQYPDPNGANMSFGSENTNASYYPFYAKIDDTEDIEEGEAEIQLSDTLTTSMDGIYLENYFIRTENDGRSYVYIQGDDGKLQKQYVTTGRSIYGYAMEIRDGLEATDLIAFPYGKNVVEGAETKEVDALKDAYM